jgi:hypothetical protein
MARWNLANQRQKRWSPARLGANHPGHCLGPPELVELGQQRLSDLRADSDRVVVGGQELGGGVWPGPMPGCVLVGSRRRTGPSGWRRAGRPARPAGSRPRPGPRSGPGRRTPTGAASQRAADRRRRCPAGRTRSAVVMTRSGGPSLDHLVGDPVPTQPRMPRLRLHHCLHGRTRRWILTSRHGQLANNYEIQSRSPRTSVVR